MGFEWFSADGVPALNLSLGLPGLLVMLVYLLAAASLVMRFQKDLFQQATLPRAAILVGILILTPILALALVWILPFRGWPAPLTIPLLGLLTTVLAAVWGGPVTGLIVGAASGLTLGLFDTHRITHPFELALAGAVIGILTRQNYQGRLAGWLRQPVLAALVGCGIVLWPLQLLSIFVTDFGPSVDSLDRTVAQALPSLVTILIMGGIAGLLTQLMVLQWPAIQFSYESKAEVAPWQKRLNERILLTFAPLVMLAIVILVGTVAVTSYELATNLVIEQMRRSAVNASASIPFFMQEGRGLIRHFATDEKLRSPDDVTRQHSLQESMQSVAYFQQLIQVDASQNIANVYPEAAQDNVTLSPDEQNRIRLALDGSVPTEVVTFGDNGAQITFVMAITDPNTGAVLGALAGRAAMRNNPALIPVLGTLTEGAIGSGDGFIIDDQHKILLFPAKPDQEETPFSFESSDEIALSNEDGQAFRQTLADGSRQLVVVMPVAGQSDWSMVLVEPNQVALTLATQIALPTLALLVLMVAVSIPTMIGLTRSITRPLAELVKSASLIGQDQLDQPVNVNGEDEMGRLGAAFEQMRSRLKSRLSEQDRLLQVSRAVSSNLELFRAMPPILSSALDVTGAASVRIALRQGDNALQTYAAGEISAGMASLDQMLVDLVERGGTIIISQIERASSSLDITKLPTDVRSLGALSLRSDTTFYGVLWLTFNYEHSFEQSELTFLGTLAGQAAVAVANARLLSEAEEGRRKLEAVLESTSDGLIAVDNKGRVLLMNPAAEKYFGVRFEQARGRPAVTALEANPLAAMLSNLQEPATSLELPGHSGATLMANVSTIVGHDGALTGRVALLRDISALKELDNIKTVFLRMVSHDLRSPLTYMRGYLSMLPLSGELNPTQLESIEKVNAGIDHISEMTERLLYLSRLQFGDEAELELSLVDVKELLDEVEAEQTAAAKDKEIQLKMSVTDKLPLLYVDGMLMHQAVSNLVSNAIKYTPERGKVTVKAYIDQPDTITVGVADNGIGIRPEDQGRLFEAFYRVPYREGEPVRPRGTGLGLALVRAIAEAHNGSVRVESNYGKGSQFYVTIPVRKPDSI